MRVSGIIVTALLSLSCSLLAQPSITTNSSDLFGTSGQTYNKQINATGGSGSYQFSLVAGSGTPPPGINLNTNGSLTGLSNSVGTFPFIVRVFDTQTQQNNTKQLSIGLAQITNASPLPGATLGASYSVTFTVSDGPAPPFFWSGNDTPFPPGLNLDSSSGVLSGTPTATGTFSFGITAFKDITNTSATKNFSLTVTKSNPLVFTTPSPLRTATVGSAYSQIIAASGGTTPYSFFPQASPFDPNPIPAGLSLDQNTGLLGGTPTAAGNYNFTIFVQDSASPSNKVSMAYAMTIAPQLTFVTPSPLPDGVKGTNYSQAITVMGGTTPYNFSAANPPPGLTLDKLGGLTGAPTAAGIFTFTVFVADSTGAQANKQYQVTIQDVAPPVVVAPLSVNFTAQFSGDSPDPRFIDVTPGGTQPTAFKVVPDGGPNTAAPAWFTVKPLTGNAPTRVVLSADQGAMAPGRYSARALITDSSQNTTAVAATLTVVDAAQKLDIAPSFLRYPARIQAPGVQEQVLVVRNAGGRSPLSFSTSILGNEKFISSLTPSSGQIARNTTALVRVRIDTSGLAVGSHRLVIHFTSSGGDMDVPVTVFVSASGSILGLNYTGVRAEARQGAGFSNYPTVKILDIGDPNTSVTWSAELVAGADLFALGTSGKTATPTNPGVLSFTPTPTALQMAPGGYYGLARITAPGSLNSPQYVVIVLHISSSASPPLADLAPTGFFFSAAPGTQSGGQVLVIHTSSTTTVPFEAAATTSDGGNWLVLSPTSGTASSLNPGQVTLSLNVPAGQAPGILTGEVSVSMSGNISTANVTAVVTPVGSVAATIAPHAGTPQAACAPSKLALTESGLVNNFAVPAKWPATLMVQLNDDCANPVLNGSVVASFSNGDAPVTLSGNGQSGTYSTSWQPIQDTSQMVVTLRATAGTLQPVTMQLTGSVAPNQAPVLFPNATVDPFYRVGGGALSAGTLVEVYGSGLASGTAAPSTLPLPTILNGTFVNVGGIQVPLVFLSTGQVNVQVPYELTPTQQYAILVSANNQFTMQDMIDIVPLTPGLAGFDDGHIIAQHAVDFSLVDAAHPAKPGEFLVMYLLGMGPTNPSVISGVGSPGAPPATVTPLPTVQVGGMNADVVFAGLTPALVGLYQVNIRVPPNAPNGDLDVVVAQGTVVTNTRKLPVAK
jgi:uncharacterized protein (TIGR03437 family)